VKRFGLGGLAQLEIGLHQGAPPNPAATITDVQIELAIEILTR